MYFSIQLFILLLIPKSHILVLNTQKFKLAFRTIQCKNWQMITLDLSQNMAKNYFTIYKSNYDTNYTINTEHMKNMKNAYIHIRQRNMCHGSITITIKY